MALLSLRDVTVQFAGPPLLDGVNLEIERGQRVALVGRNGSGKTTLLRLLCGELEPDHGEVAVAPGAEVARLEQEVPAGREGSTFDVVADGLGRHARLVAEYHALGSRMSAEGGESLLAELERVQHALETSGGWETHRRVEQVLSRMQLDAEATFGSLSAGMKRRVLLARALVSEPDILLLDEPTNHLDIAAIAWLEEFLARYEGTLVFVTHDRAFLGRVATRIVEIDRGKLFDWSCDYATFLVRKEAALAAEARQQALFDKRLAEEEVWIRQGIKARRTRNEGRVRALEAMREERLARRQVAGTAKITAQAAERSGRVVIEARGLGFAYDARTIFRDLSTDIMRGDKIGVVGPNGSGKTTLLRVLLGELPPTAGTVRHGVRLQVAYFDQLRAKLDVEKTVAENVGDGYDTVKIEGKPRHIIGYLQDFLFAPERARSPVKQLSGGERNRLLLAKLFTKPSNVLVLDEPTNDLDVETLELLESLLVDYPGTVLLVSHDRTLLNNVVTSALVLDGAGGVNEYVGGFDDWGEAASAAERAVDAPASEASKPSDAEKATAKASRRAASPPARRKLSYKERRELEGLPERIETLEGEQQDLHATLADPAFYRREGTEIAEAKARLEAVERELGEVYSRWEELESLR